MARPASTLPEDFPKPVFRPLDGHVEIAVAEAAEARMARPRRVTAILAAMCARLGSAEGGADSARRVSAAGREWLLQRAGLEFFRGTRWFEAPCPGCGARFDLELDLTAVPQGRAGAGFPVIEVETSLGARRFEAPNGHHEEAFAARRDGDARRIFAGLCGLADEAAAEVARFEAADLERIDAALEAVSPEIADGVNAACPDCGFRTLHSQRTVLEAATTSQSGRARVDYDCRNCTHQHTEYVTIAKKSERSSSSGGSFGGGSSSGGGASGSW